MVKRGCLYRVGQFFLVLFLVWFVLTLFFVIKNQFSTNFKDLSKDNQIVLQEMEDYYKAYKKKKFGQDMILTSIVFLL